jgi:hypothetical protein
MLRLRSLWILAILAAVAVSDFEATADAVPSVSDGCLEVVFWNRRPERRYPSRNCLGTRQHRSNMYAMLGYANETHLFILFEKGTIQCIPSSISFQTMDTLPPSWSYERMMPTTITANAASFELAARDQTNGDLFDSHPLYNDSAMSIPLALLKFKGVDLTNTWVVIRYEANIDDVLLPNTFLRGKVMTLKHINDVPDDADE